MVGTVVHRSIFRNNQLEIFLKYAVFLFRHVNGFSAVSDNSKTNDRVSPGLTFLCSRAAYSYSGATSFATSQTKGVSKHHNPPKTPSDYRATSRQFGKNVYV